MKIVLSGYYGFNNTGDEAILEALILGLKQLGSDLQLTVLSGNPKETAEIYGVAATGRLNLSVLSQGDIFLSGGGGLLQDVTSLRSFLYYLGVIALAQILGKKTVIFAQGIGPLKNPLHRFLLKWILQKVDLITVRDEDSFSLLKKLGLNKPKTYLTADPTFLLSPENGEKFLNLEGVAKDQGPLIGISVRSVSNFENLALFLAKMGNFFVEEFKAQVIFIPFQCPEDVLASQKVIDAMEKPATLIFRQCRPQEILGIISQMDLFLGMRLHSLIFSVIAKVPCLGIAYDPKVAALMKSIEQPYHDISHLDENNLKDELKKIRENQEKIKNQLERVRKKLYDKAWSNFVIFQEFIKGR